MSQEDRLISLNTALNAFKKELTVGESKGNYVTICSAVGYEGAKQILEALPSAQRWIPVAVRLPDKYEYVLLTCEHNGNLVTDFGCISPDVEGYDAWWIAAHDSLEGWRVIAWMPLPQPRKGPITDAVPVVRCKDCKWYNKLGCAISINDESDKPKETDFCSFGERKERINE